MQGVERKPVPLVEAERILRAMRQMVDAKHERDAAILAALKAGASIREIGKVAGMSQSQIQIIAKDMGWPDRTEQARRDRVAAEKKQLDDLMAAYVRGDVR